MYTDMLKYGLDHEFSSLHPTLKGRGPDESFSTVPYEKGFQFLTYLESLIGEDNFQEMLRGYILANQQKSVVFHTFRAHWEDYVATKYESAADVNRILKQVHWERWVYEPGLPPVTLDFSTNKSDEARALADKYIELKGASSPENMAVFDDYYSNLKVIFIEQLVSRSLTGTDVTKEVITRIDGDYNLSSTVDPEIKQRWLPLGIKLAYDAVTEPSHTFVTSQGRLKYLTPIYSALQDNGKKDTAVQWFNECLEFYHPLAIQSLKKLLGITSGDRDVPTATLIQ